MSLYENQQLAEEFKFRADVNIYNKALSSDLNKRIIEQRLNANPNLKRIIESVIDPDVIVDIAYNVIYKNGNRKANVLYMIIAAFLYINVRNYYCSDEKVYNTVYLEKNRDNVNDPVYYATTPSSVYKLPYDNPKEMFVIYEIFLIFFNNNKMMKFIQVNKDNKASYELKFITTLFKYTKRINTVIYNI